MSEPQTPAEPEPLTEPPAVPEEGDRESDVDEPEGGDLDVEVELEE